MDARKSGSHVLGDMVGVYPITSKSSGWLLPGKYGFRVVNVLAEGNEASIIQGSSFATIQLGLYAVPEPSVGMLLGTGLFAFAFFSVNKKGGLRE